MIHMRSNEEFWRSELASTLDLPEGSSWDDIVDEVERLKAQSSTSEDLFEGFLEAASKSTVRPHGRARS